MSLRRTFIAGGAVTRVVTFSAAVLALALLAGCQWSPDTSGSSWLVPARVVKHVDGDTLRLVLPDGTEEPVRLIGIDTPEDTSQHEPWGREASRLTESLAPVGARVYLEYDAERRDRHDRLLAYVWLYSVTSDGEDAVRASMLNARIALAGLASPLTVQPNSKYAHLFARFVAEARENQLGMWDPKGTPAPIR